MTHALVAGLVAGLAIAIPLGAIAVLIVYRSVENGFRVGAAAGLGAATVDGVYATLAVTFGAVVAPIVSRHAQAIAWMSAAVLAVLAIMIARPAWRPRPPVPAAAGEPAAASRAATPLRSYLLVLTLTLANPATVIYFVALAAGPSLGEDPSWPERAAFVVGVMLGSAAWQVLLAAAGAAFRGKLLGQRARRWSAAVGGALVLALAVRAALGA